MRPRRPINCAAVGKSGSSRLHVNMAPSCRHPGRIGPASDRGPPSRMQGRSHAQWSSSTATAGRSECPVAFATASTTIAADRSIDLGGSTESRAPTLSAACLRHRPIDRERSRGRPLTLSDGTSGDPNCCAASSARKPASRLLRPPRSGACTLVLRPGTAGLQEKSWPIETFFHKIVMLRNRLRTSSSR